MSHRDAIGLLATFWMLASGTLVGPARAGDWAEQRVAGPFQIRADFSLAEYPQLIAQLEQLQRDLVETLQLTPAGQSIQLFLFRDQGAYRGYLKQYFPGTPDRRALFIKGRGPGMVFAYQNAEFEVDVRHECTHALLHTMLPIVPLWLDEGLAEYFEVPPGERRAGNPHQSPTRWAAWLYKTRRLEQLEAVRDVSQMGPGEYRSAWAWVHFMLHGPPAARQQLTAALYDLQHDQPPELISHRLHRALPDLDSQFRHHFRSWK